MNGRFCDDCGGAIPIMTMTMMKCTVKPHVGKLCLAQLVKHTKGRFERGTSAQT